MKDAAGGADNGTMGMGLKSAKSGSDPQILGRIQEIIRGDPARVIWRNLSLLLHRSRLLANFPAAYFLWIFKYFPQELKQSGLVGLVECIYFWPQKATAGWDVKYHRMEIWDSVLSATGSRKPRRHGAPNYGAEPDAGAAGMAESEGFGTDADNAPPKADTEKSAADIETGAVAAFLAHQCQHRAPLQSGLQDARSGGQALAEAGSVEKLRLWEGQIGIMG